MVPLSGCVVKARSYDLPEQETSLEDDQALTSSTAALSGDSINQAATATPDEIAEIEKIAEALSCGDNFCQIDWSGWLARPFTYPDRERIDLTYPYASTGDGSLAIHHGVEFPNPHGTLVHASAQGEVIFAGTDDEEFIGPYKNFYGNVVIIRHPGLFNGEDLYALYGHLSSIEVSQGEGVELGDILGRVGASGVAEGSHLHFEVRYGLNDYTHSTNPVLWFSPLTNQSTGETGSLAGIIVDRHGNPVGESPVTLQKLDQDDQVEKTCRARIKSCQISLTIGIFTCL
ncbi:MAG: M23 family metallopeptidase [Chloroflexota bacterium]|nr:M23 family metallopeptidase [Chloroflexota bacterium]